MTEGKGKMSSDEAAVTPTTLALLPPNATEPKGQMLDHKNRAYDWYTDKPRF